MKTIQLTCSRCNATMMLEKRGNQSSIFCPYCGNSTNLLIESDRVKVAQIKADTERLGMELSFREHRDYLAEAHSRRKGQIVIICIFAAVTAALIWVLLNLDPADFFI